MSRLVRAGAAAALALSLASCAGKAPDTASSSSSSSAAPSSSATGRTIEVGYAGGTITGGGRKQVRVGSSVTIRVTSDVADEVHVHGYDLMTDVTPGTPATVTFEATIPGVFEVELEKLGQQLLTLQVQ